MSAAVQNLQAVVRACRAPAPQACGAQPAPSRIPALPAPQRQRGERLQRLRAATSPDTAHAQPQQAVRRVVLAVDSSQVSQLRGAPPANAGPAAARAAAAPAARRRSSLSVPLPPPSLQDSVGAFNWVLSNLLSKPEDELHLLHVVPDVFTSPAR